MNNRTIDHAEAAILRELGLSTEERCRRDEEALRLLRDWMADESGYDERVWPAVKAALNETCEALGAEQLFDD